MTPAVQELRLAHKRSIFSASATTMLGTAIAAALGMLFVSLSARWLGPEGYARVGANIAAANLFFLTLHPLEAGLTLAVTRAPHATLRSHAVRRIRGLACAAILLLLPWLLLAPYIARASRLGSTLDVRLLGLLCCAALLTCGPRAVLRGRELFGALAGNFVFESAFRLGLGCGALWLLHGSESVLAGYALGTTLAIVPATLQGLKGLPRAARTPFTRDELWLPFRALSAPLLALNLYTALAANLDVLAANHFLDAHQAGLYAGAASLSRMVPVAASPVLLVLFSRLAAQRAAGEDTASTMRLGALWVLLPLCLSLLFPALAGQWLLRLVLGSAYADAHALLLCQWASACVVTAQLFFAEALLATSRVRAGWLFLVPCTALAVALLLVHDSALRVAQVTLIACATVGTLVCVALARLRER